LIWLGRIKGKDAVIDNLYRFANGGVSRRGTFWYRKRALSSNGGVVEEIWQFGGFPGRRWPDTNWARK
jgi:hypothetical protein